MPAIHTFLEEAATPPADVDMAAVERGQGFFNRLVAHHFSAVYGSTGGSARTSGVT